MHNFRNTVSFSSSVLASLWSDMKDRRQSKHYSGIPFSGQCCFPYHLIYLKPETYIILWLTNPTESTFINGSECHEIHKIYCRLSTFPFTCVDSKALAKESSQTRHCIENVASNCHIHYSVLPNISHVWI